MTDLETTAADTLRTRAAKSLDAMRAAITRADAARSDAAHQARAAHVVDAAQTAATNHRALARRRRGRRGGELPAALRLCGHARRLDHPGALGAGGLTGRRRRRADGEAGRRPRRPRLAPGHAWRGTASDAARRSKSGTSVRLSSSRAISIGRPMAAPGPVTAAWTSTRA